MDSVIVEVVNRFGQVRSRHRLSTFPATIGRAHTSDVILDEADVSAHHARVERSADGGLELVDAGATNGIRVNRTRVTRLKLGDVTDVRLASAHLRLVSAEARAPKTILFRLSRLDRWRFAGLGLFLFLVATLLEEWGVKSVRVQATEVVKEGAQVLLVVIGGWVFLWSLASRVAHGRSKAVGHFSADTLGFAGLTLLQWGVKWPCSVLRVGPGLTGVLTVCFSLALAGWVLFQHLTRVVSWKPRRVALTAALVAVAVALLMVVSDAARAAKYSIELPLSGAHLPPALLLGPVSDDPELSARIAALQKEVDALKQEP